MIESTPGTPYCALPCFPQVEHNMRGRRLALASLLNSNEAAFSMSHFPLMGVGQFTSPLAQPRGPIAYSLFTPDDVINAHPRFGYY